MGGLQIHHREAGFKTQRFPLGARKPAEPRTTESFVCYHSLSCSPRPQEGKEEVATAIAELLARGPNGKALE